jgi:hypothetical protein
VRYFQRAEEESVLPWRALTLCLLLGAENWRDGERWEERKAASGATGTSRQGLREEGLAGGALKCQTGESVSASSRGGMVVRLCAQQCVSFERRQGAQNWDECRRRKLAQGLYFWRLCQVRQEGASSTDEECQVEAWRL